jgi:hypothetical protein
MGLIPVGERDDGDNAGPHEQRGARSHPLVGLALPGWLLATGLRAQVLTAERLRGSASIATQKAGGMGREVRRELLKVGCRRRKAGAEGATTVVELSTCDHVRAHGFQRGSVPRGARPRRQ